MTEINPYRAGRYCVFDLSAHLVFVAKCRGDIFSGDHLASLEGILRSVCDDFECELLEFTGSAEHVHLLVQYPPKVSVSKLVNSLKGVSSRRLKQLHPELEQTAYRGAALWSPSYYAGNARDKPAAIEQYLKQQGC